MKPQLEKTKEISKIGEPIGLEKGNELINNNFSTGQTSSYSYIIGRTIIEKILSQPKCEGIKFFEAINEFNEKTLVFMGVDHDGNEIIKYALIHKSGEYQLHDGIVADRIKTIPFENDEEYWNFD